MKNRILLVMFLLALAIGTTVLTAATDSAPSGSNVLANVPRVTPTQASFDVPIQTGVATAKTWDTTVVGTSPRKISTVYGASLPAGTNKLMIRCSIALAFGDSTTTNVPGTNLVTVAGTDAYFRGSKAELDNMYITVATSTAGTYSIYLFPFVQK